MNDNRVLIKDGIAWGRARVMVDNGWRLKMTRAVMVMMIHNTRKLWGRGATMMVI